MRILIVEDNAKMADIIKRGLVENGYAVDIAYTGEEGEKLAEEFPFDVILLDIILPGKNGIEVCRTLRRKNIKTPILMLTAKDSVADRVKGLDSGADDYLVKPFEFPELFARIRALLRRRENIHPQDLQAGDLVMNTLTKQVWKGERIIDLTGKEYAILEYLMRNPNLVITRTMIEQHIWNLSMDTTSNLVDVFIRKLRQKINDENQESRIQTVKGSGYRMVV